MAIVKVRLHATINRVQFVFWHIEMSARAIIHCRFVKKKFQMYPAYRTRLIAVCKCSFSGNAITKSHVWWHTHVLLKLISPYLKSKQPFDVLLDMCKLAFRLTQIPFLTVTAWYRIYSTT
jgi:hypothetical protein